MWLFLALIAAEPASQPRTLLSPTPSTFDAAAPIVWPSTRPEDGIPDFELTEEAQRSFRRYLGQALVLRVNGAARAPTITKNQIQLKFGAAGEGYERIFEKSPRALEAAASYRRMRVGGIIALVLGGAIAVVTTALTIARTWDWPWLFLGAGTAVSAGTIGGFLLGFSPAELSRAVAYYNEDAVLEPGGRWQWLADDDEP